MPAIDNVRKRWQDVPEEPNIDLRRDNKLDEKSPSLLAGRRASDVHPGGRTKHGSAKQYLRMFLFAVYFLVSCISINLSQYMGVPLYWYNQDWYYAWMAVTKQHFGLLVVTLQQWWSPTMIRVSSDDNIRDQFTISTDDGRLETKFPERIVLIANHQLYTDWLYLWWFAYTSRMHGHLFIILKESLKYVPILGQGMQFFSFIFLSRKWETDQSRFQHRLQKLKTRHHGLLSGTQDLDPMWLLIFPEGTNMSKGGKQSSAKWSEKTGLPDLENVLLPRTTGLLYCLRELRGTVDWIYDCTVAYEGIPKGQFGQDIFTLPSTYFKGRPPKSVNMYWRRFAMSSVPIDDKDAFEIWMIERWVEKDKMMEYYLEHGRFPVDGDIKACDSTAGSVHGGNSKPVYVETQVKPRNPVEFLQIFLPWLGMLMVVRLFKKALTFGSTERYTQVSTT